MVPDLNSPVAEIDISIVIINWNTAQLLANCIESIAHNHQKLSIEIIVIDNGSNDGSQTMIKNCFPQIHLIENLENVGFARGCNQGIAIARGCYVLLLNPDTIVQSNALEQLKHHLDEHQRIAAVGPSVFYADGTIQTAGESFVGLRKLALRKLLPFSIIPKLAPTSKRVDWLSGVCLLLRKSALVDIGLLDENYWMYSEDMQWCWRAQKLGWAVAVVPQAQITHYHGQSARANLEKAEINDAINMLHWLSIYHGKWAVPLGGFILTTSYIGRAIVALLSKDECKPKWRIYVRCAGKVAMGIIRNSQPYSNENTRSRSNQTA